MDAERDTVRTAALMGVLFAGFFIGGFAFHSVTAPSTPTGNVAADHPHDEPAAVSPQAAADKAMQKLASGPLSYPFTYNISTVSVENDTRIPGTTFYKTTVSYVVEPNPFKSSLYTVPKNQTSTTKTLTVYVSQDGKFLFQNAPISTAVQQQQQGPDGGVLP
ncbi:MAG: hypothetical protein SVW02_01650 [Candidatus Nanohaloarchaea archaeon]|nr:hypothetical protein [Candidatus Nanohaloarchaea archaeon]